MSAYANQSEIDAVVESFETCQTAGDAFTHAKHLTVALWYLRDADESAALVRMRESLMRFLAYHGEDVQKYNETITLFWLKLIQQALGKMTEQKTFLEITNAVISSFDNSRLLFDYYSEELVRSEAAKTRWVPPNLKSLE